MSQRRKSDCVGLSNPFVSRESGPLLHGRRELGRLHVAFPTWRTRRAGLPEGRLCTSAIHRAALEELNSTAPLAPSLNFFYSFLMRSRVEPSQDWRQRQGLHPILPSGSLPVGDRCVTISRLDSVQDRAPTSPSRCVSLALVRTDFQSLGRVLTGATGEKGQPRCLRPCLPQFVCVVVCRVPWAWVQRCSFGPFQQCTRSLGSIFYSPSLF